MSRNSRVKKVRLFSITTQNFQLFVSFPLCGADKKSSAALKLCDTLNIHYSFQSLLFRNDFEVLSRGFLTKNRGWFRMGWKHPLSLVHSLSGRYIEEAFIFGKVETQ